VKEKFKKIDLKTRILGLLACFYVVILISFQQVEAVQELKDYEPAISIELKDGKKKAVKYLVKSTSLENVLNDLNIKLGEEDSINLKMDTEIEEGAKINITRVTYEEERVKEKIAYEIEYVDSTDPNLFGTRVKSEGQEGIKEVIYKKRLINGKEVKREKIGSEVTKEPVAAVVERGTVGTGVTFTGRLTRYGADCVGCGNRTAAGLYVTTNGVENSGKVTMSYNGGEYYVLAADGSIPFGSILKVSNHGFSIPDPFYGIVLDRGGAITGTNVDVFCGGESASFFSGGTSYSTQFEIVALGNGSW
jgi:Uncharacterized protein conserved in bacteria